jgi:hypothetical protein
MILVLVDITMRLEARNTHVNAFNLPMSSEEEMREVEKIGRRARRRRLPTVRRLQLSGHLERYRACVDKSIRGDDNGNFKFNNGQQSVFDTLMDAKDEDTGHIIACFISSDGGTGKTYLWTHYSMLFDLIGVMHGKKIMMNHQFDCPLHLRTLSQPF